MTDIEIINKYLETFGKSYDGRPIFRIVWSSDQTEKRYGSFAKFYGSIYLGEKEEVQERKKYEDIDVYDKWVLEQLEFSIDPSIINSEKGHYEPKWVFRTKEGEYQRPIMEAVQYLMRKLTEHVVRKDKRTLENEENESKKKNIARIKEMLDLGNVVDSLHAGEGVSLSGAYKDVQ